MTDRGVLTVDDLKARSKVDPTTRCWNWQGAATKGQPRIWTLDYERIVKRVLPGPKAVWNIAHNEPPPRWATIYRSCCNSMCVNPVHMRAGTRDEMFAHIKRAGVWRNGRRAQAARKGIEEMLRRRGVVLLPDEIVREIRLAPKTMTGRSLAKRFGIHENTVSRIRLGRSYRHVQVEQE